MQPVGQVKPALGQSLPLPGLGFRPVDLEDRQPTREFGRTRGERIQAGAQEHVLADPSAGLLGDQVLDGPGAGEDARPERPGADRVHVRPLPPQLVPGGQPQTELIIEHVPGIVDLDVPCATASMPSVLTSVPLSRRWRLRWPGVCQVGAQCLADQCRKGGLGLDRAVLDLLDQLDRQVDVELLNLRLHAEILAS